MPRTESLTPGQCRAFYILCRHGATGMKAKDVADMAGFDTPEQAERALRQLVRKGAASVAAVGGVRFWTPKIWRTS